MFYKFPLRQSKVLHPASVDEKTLSFLSSLPGVQIHLGPHEDYFIEVPKSVQTMKVARDLNGNSTWLYGFPSGKILGHDTEGDMIDESVWPATEEMWQATTSFEFDLACYRAQVVADLLSPNEPPPNKADYGDE